MTSKTMRVREASRDDAAVIATVIRAAWRGVNKQFGLSKKQLPGSPAYCRPEWITKGLDKGVRFFLAEVDAKAVGCVGMTAPKDGASELVRLAVLPAQRRNGLGAMLVEHVVSQALSLGLERVDLALIADRTELLQWYEKQGFTLTRVDSPPHLPFKVAWMSREVAGQKNM